jgi:hypothetical protein
MNLGKSRETNHNSLILARIQTRYFTNANQTRYNCAQRPTIYEIWVLAVLFKFVDRKQFWLKSGNNNGYFTRRLNAFLRLDFPEWRIPLPLTKARSQILAKVPELLSNAYIF